MKVNYTTKQKKNISISVFICLLIISCKNIKQEDKQEGMKQFIEYKDLHENQGTKNYEIISVIGSENLLEEFFLDKNQDLLSIISFNNENELYLRKKVDIFGNILSQKLSLETLKDGTMWSEEGYSNWFINGNETLHKYIDPFTNKVIKNINNYYSKQDKKKWLSKFDELYNSAGYVHSWNGFYYFKLNKKWYMMSDEFKVATLKFEKKYPIKTVPNEIHMVNIPEISDRILGKELKIVKYIEQDKREGRGLNPINFSSGYYMFELHLPQGDVLKFRRYGAVGFSADLNIYQIPEELGGSNEVYFIEQKPREMYPNKSFGGFYAIRPKNYKELPEYKPYLEKEKQEEFKKRRSF